MNSNKNLNEKNLDNVSGGGYINWNYDKETGTTTIDAKYTDEEFDHLPRAFKNTTKPHNHLHSCHGCRGGKCPPKSWVTKPGTTDTPAGPSAGESNEFSIFS